MGGGVIGDQGLEGDELNGNKWFDKWPNIIPFRKAYCFSASAVTDSRFFLNTPQSVRTPGGFVGYTYFSEFHPPDVDPDISDEWFKYDETGYLTEISCQDRIVSTVHTDKKIATNEIDNGFLTPGQVWTGKRYLYSKLLHYPELQSDYFEFETFLSNESQTSVGQLYNIKQKIMEGMTIPPIVKEELDAIRMDQELAIKSMAESDQLIEASTNAINLNVVVNQKRVASSQLLTLDSLLEVKSGLYQAHLSSKLLEAWNLNNQVIAINSFEQHEKNVNDISLRSILFQDGVFTPEQMELLSKIASLCPKYEGPGVYHARGLLTECVEAKWNDNNAECYPEMSIPQEQVLENAFQPRSSAKPLNPKALFVFPNPASDKFFIKIPDGEMGSIIVSDMTGKVWKNLDVSESQEIQHIEIKDMPDGIYSCLFKEENGSRQVTRVVVLKK